MVRVTWPLPAARPRLDWRRRPTRTAGASRAGSRRERWWPHGCHGCRGRGRGQNRSGSATRPGGGPLPWRPGAGVELVFDHGAVDHGERAGAPPWPLGGAYNLATHLVAEQLGWQPFRRQLNHWRRQRLGLVSVGLLGPGRYQRRRALRRAGCRGVLARGWAALTGAMDDDDLVVVDELPHDWLFARMAAVVHHGGAGTTHTGLRAGIPTVVVPFFTDQPFWAQRGRRPGRRTGPDPPRA